MQKIIAILATICLFSAGVVCAERGQGRIEGKVVNADTGKPAQGVRLVLLEHREDPEGQFFPFPAPFETTTNKSGRFSFKDIPDGDWNVAVRDDVMAPSGPDIEVSIGEKRKVKDVSIQVLEGCSLEGGVYMDEDFEQGAPNCILKLVTMYEMDKNARIFSTATGPDGQYRLGGIPAGAYRLHAGPDQPYVSCSPVFIDDTAVEFLNLNRRAHLTGVEFQVLPLVETAGIALDTKGNPVTNACISICRGATDRRYVVYPSAEADENGRFTIYLQAGCASKIRASSGSSRSLCTECAPVTDTEKTDAEPCVLILTACGRITGDIVDGAGNPISDICCILEYPKDLEGPSSTGLSVDNSGHFDSRELYPGKYTISVSDYKDNYNLDAFEPIEIDLQEGQIVEDLRIAIGNRAEDEGAINAGQAGYEVKQSLTISGKITGEDGNPLANAFVDCIKSFNQDAGSAPASETGEYTIVTYFESDETLSGPLSLTARAPDYNRAFLRDVKLGSDNNDFVLTPAPRVTLSVVSDPTGKAVETFRLEAHAEMSYIAEGSLAGERFERNVSPGDGPLQLSLPAAKWCFSVQASGFLEERKCVEIPPDGGEMTVEVRMKKGASLAGVIKNANGVPVAGANIFLSNPADRAPGIPMAPYKRFARAASLESDSKGRFLIEGLYPGETSIRISHDDYPRAEQTVAIKPEKTTKTTITLEAFCRVEGRVTLGGEPISGVGVSSGSYGHGIARTGSDGTYAIPGVQPGEHDILAALDFQKAMGQRVLTKPVNVLSGEIASVNFDFKPGGSGFKGVLRVNNVPAKAMVFFRSFYDSGDWEESILTTSPDGYYNFEELPPGPALVKFCSGRRSYSERLTLLPGIVMQHDVDIAPGVSISGSVQGAVGDRIDSVRLYWGTATAMEPGTVFTSSGSDPLVISGSLLINSGFTLNNVLPGAYTLLLIRSIDERKGCCSDYTTVTRGFPATSREISSQKHKSGAKFGVRWQAERNREPPAKRESAKDRLAPSLRRAGPGFGQTAGRFPVS